ncbi:MAG TPA: CHASE3 domain-containing protein, partial [Thermomonas sp.]|nr:CHASE3 domain-containing protein [Thermomonas sp.]
MPQTPAPIRQSVGLIALIGALVMLIVVGPFWVVREANRKSMDAAAIVNHTHEIESTVQGLMYDLRNRESATVAYAYGHDSPAIRERLAESQKEIPVNMARLTQLTRDNPEQQVRIGKLGSIIEQRGMIMETVLAKPAGQADPRDIEWLLDRNPLRHIGAEILDHEQALLKDRTSEASRLSERSALLTWLAMLLQLLLLGAVAVLLRLQWRNRRAAEAAAARSSARALSVLQTVREPMAVVDRDLRVVLHNPAFREVFAAADAEPGTPIGAFGGGTW